MVLGKNISVPSLDGGQLLILDAFSDFTPVQGETLRPLIPRVPEVIVNLNHDARNPEIFLPFQSTIDHLRGIASFEICDSDPNNIAVTCGALSGLRENLFKPTLSDKLQLDVDEDQGDANAGKGQAEIKYFECGDRDTEIRHIAKEIKRLVRCESYSLADIALVVRQRASYAEVIARVMREESLPCNLEARREVGDIPSARAALKLLAILEQAPENDLSFAPRLAELADLIKSEYFRLSDEDLTALSVRFDAEHGERKKQPVPARDIQPAAIAWAALVIEKFATLIKAVPREGEPAALRLATMKLLEQLCFRAQVSRPIRSTVTDSELPQAMLNFNTLEALRRAFAAAIRSIEIAASIGNTFAASLHSN